ncbi:carboxymuconolactone decarboxylase family protein [Desulfopila inferna]|uniref:carboxymuconolactone decarboxylase family protein n=1 Tax=Desulfopila inferna TaxID=468528 RepID=UPI0019622B65|nr:carboxymuconolactone decarboxylase family protein [Desulfopila inferna]MBM9604626.1 carboxymuconolactone decarboxylase family protein [Desulfopila inferna]
MTTEHRVPSKHFNELVKQYPAVFEAHEKLGTEIRSAGPLDEKTLQLLQLAAAGAIGSEGAVHSHTRRALAAGVSVEEIYHANLALISTIGFPSAMAAISWSRDIIEK